MSARREAVSTASTIWAWAACLVTSWLAMQTIDLAFRVLQ